MNCLCFIMSIIIIVAGSHIGRWLKIVAFLVELFLYFDGGFVVAHHVLVLHEFAELFLGLHVFDHGGALMEVLVLLVDLLVAKGDFGLECFFPRGCVGV